MKIALSLLLLNRKLRPGIESDLLQYVEGIYLSPDVFVTVDCVILDEVAAETKWSVDVPRVRRFCIYSFV